MMKLIENGKYEILQFSLYEGWVNNLYDGNDNPYFFPTIEDAVAELQEEFDDWQAEIDTGSRDEDDGFDICTFQIRYSIRGMIYELDMVDGKIIVSQEFSYQ